MKKTSLAFAICFFVLLIGTSAYAQAPGTAVFNSIPSPMPGNVPSQGYQCCGTSELGDEVRLEADTPRRAGNLTVLMSSWSLHSNYPALPAAGYAHEFVMNLYVDEASARSRSPFASVTQTSVVPWRPEADPTCPGGTAWRASPTQCFNGLAFTMNFDLRHLNLNLPDQFIWGLSYNTNTWGYAPLGVPGPYESLNVGTANVNGVGVPPSVGMDVEPDVAYWNTAHASFYTDLGAAGFGVFRPDTNWSGYEPAMRLTTFAMPDSTQSCKNGAWANLVRADFSPFKNQGACVSYVNTGK